MNETREITVVELMAQIRSGLTFLTLQRLRAGASIADLAGKIDMEPTRWWNILRGHETLTERELADMAFALDARIGVRITAWEETF